MKKVKIIVQLFLTLVVVLPCSNSWSQAGHAWWFGSTTPPFVSTPGAGVTPVTLSKLGAGDIDTGETDEHWTACVQGITHVASFEKGVGLHFPNDPANPVGNNYTIEMLFKLSASEDATFRRLIGFYNLNILVEPSNANNGIYVRSDNQLSVYTNDSTPQVISGAISVNVWHHLVFVRNDTTNIVSVYHNGSLKGTFADDDRHLVPRRTNASVINFFKDEEGPWVGYQETSGKIAKLAIYNAVLTETQVNSLFSFPCDTDPVSMGLPGVDTANAWRLTGNGNNNDSSFLGTTTNTPLIVKTNNAEAMRILPTGEVGIGDSAARAGYKLAVKGNILAEKVTVKPSGSWPDYVFDSLYPLMSLEEVSDFLQKHKHLPGVPSANEVQEKGVEVASLQTTLLKKIEELTLYILAIREEMEEKNKRINELIEKNKKKE